MNDENGIHEIMAEGIGDEPPIVGGPGRVFEQARRVRVRQRSLTGALSVVAVLGVAAGAVAVGRSGKPTTGAGVAAASGATSAATAPAATTDPTTADATSSAPTSASGQAVPPAKTTSPLTGDAPACDVAPPAASTQGQSGTVPMDARSSLELLKDLLPKGFTGSHFVGEDGGTNWAGMAINDGHGQVGIGVNTLQAGISGDGVGCALPDGSRLYLGSLNGDKPTSGGYPSLGEYVRRVFPDGTSIAIQVFNYWSDWATAHPAHWQATTTRPTLPLTNAQLLAMAADSRWGTTVPAAFAQQARHDLVPYTAI